MLTGKQREIKFRIWDKLSGRMEKVQQLIFGINYDYGRIIAVIECVDKDNNQETIYKTYQRVIYTDRLWKNYNGEESEGILMQYTGLKDAHGKEIYEGDIVKNKLGLFVVIEDGCAMFEVRDEQRITFKQLPLIEFFAEDENVEVIGNITKLFKARELKSEILVASIRSQPEILQTLSLGAHHITVPFSLYEEIMNHPLTLEAIEKFSQAIDRL